MALVGARPAPSLPLGLGRPSRRVPATIRRRRSAAFHSSATRRLREVTGLPQIIAAIGAAVCLAIFYLSQSSHVAEMGYELARLEGRIAQLHSQQQQLTLQINQARSPALIEREAVDRLGLRPIGEDRITFAQPATATRSVE